LVASRVSNNKENGVTVLFKQ